MAGSTDRECVLSQDTFIPVRPSAAKIPKWVSAANYRVVSPDNMLEAMQEIVESKHLAWDSEFEPTFKGHEVEAFSFSTKPNTGWLLPVKMTHLPNMPLDVVKRFVYAFSKKRNVCQNSRAEMRTVMDTWHGEDLLNITDDIQVIFYLLDPNEAKDFSDGARPTRRGIGLPAGFSLSEMSAKYLKVEIPDLGPDFWKKGGRFRDLHPSIAIPYACADADITLRLFEKGMDPAMERSFIYRLEMQLIPILLEMERLGMRFNKERLAEVERQVRDFVFDTRNDAYDKLKMDHSKNIDSHVQLAEHMHNVLGWPIIGRKTKRGLGSTNKMTLQRFAESTNPEVSDAAQAILDYKKWKTLHNNFLTKLQTYVNPHSGAIHASFLSTRVPTGRLACASPNLQQIPQRNDRAPLRRAFVPRPGYYFFEADYSQIELRVFAGEAQESFFFEAFERGEDLHVKTAERIFRCKITDKDDPRRQMGKTMNFGPIYGMKPEGLAMRTDYDLIEAERILEEFWAAIPEAERWVNTIYARCRAQGGVHTHFGRWRPIPWIHSRIPHEIQFGERSAVNTIVQGTAADIMKIGLIRLAKALAKSDWDAHLVLTVHDSVMLEVAEGTDLESFVEFVENALCFPIENYPPLAIDVKVGSNWHDMKPYEKDVTPEPSEEQLTQKQIVIPTMSRKDQEELLHKLMHAPKGETEVQFLSTQGKVVSTVTMTPDFYTHLLRFLVESGERYQKQQVEGNGNVPRVSFV